MTLHQLEAFRVLVVLLAVAALIFWRVAFKIIIGAVVILMCLLVAAFALGFLQGMFHSLM